MVNCLAPVKIPRIIGFLILVLIFYSISFTVMIDESTASWDCFRALHKQAISDAVGASPTDLKSALNLHRDLMLKQVDVIQNISKPDRKSFGSYYKNIVEAAKDRDSKRDEYIARNMVDITIYIFDAYCPFKISFCDENEILKRASVIYDGYSPTPDYSNIPSPAFDMEQQRSGEVKKMLSFYNTLVNEILDLWITVWKDAGRDISGLPEKNALLRCADTKKRAKMGPGRNLNSRDEVYDDSKKYKDRTANQIGEDRKRLDEIKITIQEAEKKKSGLAGGQNDEKRLNDELRRLHIEMDQLELRLMQRETD